MTRPLMQITAAIVAFTSIVLFVSSAPTARAEDVQVITANPKTSGGARWAFLAAYGYGAGAAASLDPTKLAPTAPIDDAKGKAYVTALYKNVPVLDTGARGATVTFAQKNIGDVLI